MSALHWHPLESLNQTTPQTLKIDTPALAQGRSGILRGAEMKTREPPAWIFF